MNEVPTRGVNPNLVVVTYFVFKSIPPLISLFALYLGFKLFVLGVTGHASLVVDTPTVGGQLLNAAPGLFFAVGGMVALVVSIWKGVKIDFKGLNAAQETADGSNASLAASRREPRHKE